MEINVTVEALTKEYNRGVWALDRVSLRLESGMFGLLGPNGAGKTTFMRILATLLRPTSGKVQVGPYSVTKQPHEVRRLLGYLPQEFGLYKKLTGQEFLEYVAALKGVEPRRRRTVVDSVLERVNLTEHRHRRTGTYSGGMRQRLGIAQALLGDPPLLIVDEPTAGLDPEERIRFRNLLAQLARERVVLLSTHIVGDIESSCERLAVLCQGRVRFTGTAAEMVQLARGFVWSFTTDEPELQRFLRAGEGRQVVSTRRVNHHLEVRAISPERPTPDAVSQPPSLEDAYLVLMHLHGQAGGREAQASRVAVAQGGEG